MNKSIHDWEHLLLYVRVTCTIHFPSSPSFTVQSWSLWLSGPWATWPTYWLTGLPCRELSGTAFDPLLLWAAYVRTYVRRLFHNCKQNSLVAWVSSQCQKCGQTTLPYCWKPDRRQSPYTPMYVHLFPVIAYTCTQLLTFNSNLISKLPLSCWTTGHFDQYRSKQSNFPLALVTKLFLCLQLHNGGAHRRIVLVGNVGNCRWLSVYVSGQHLQPMCGHSCVGLCNSTIDWEWY